MKKISQMCQQIKNSPQSLPNLGQIVQKIVTINNEQDQIQAINQFIDVIKILSINHIFESKNIQIVNYLSDKIVAIAEIILLIMVNKQSAQFNDQISHLIQYSKPETKMRIIEAILQKISSEKQFSFVEIRNGQLITSLCEKILNSKDLQSYCDFILNCPDLQEIDFKSCIMGEKSEVDNKKQLKQKYEKVLISLLKNDCEFEEKIKLYRGLGLKVFSKLSNPLILSEHLLALFRQDTRLQIQVLSSLFLLVGKFGLDLQGFYNLLEKLISTKSIYNLPNSRRFFKLLEVALKSSRVPFQTISKFAVIIVQQIYQQQSEFAYWGLSFIINLSKKHRQLLQFIKQLPEIVLLRSHYSKKIRALLSELDKNLNKVQYLDLDAFSSIKVTKILNNRIQSLIQKLASNYDQATFLIPPTYDYI